MAVWAIGDLQGCHDTAQRLLQRIGFDPARDRLWLCGDMVNRGGQSLATLRLVHSLRANVACVLGNHDLSLLALAERAPDEQRKVNADLQSILFADDRDVLLGWLRQQPLLHIDRSLGWMMVHAGLAPGWSIAQAEQYAREIGERLRGNQYHAVLRGMYGTHPAWSPRLTGTLRRRAIINYFTRLRFCSLRGRMALDEKGAPGTQAPGLYPWYEVPGHAERELKIVFGHWSALGLFIGHGVYGLDTGAVRGGKLTALQLDSEDIRVVQVPGRAVSSPADIPQT